MREIKARIHWKDVLVIFNHTKNKNNPPYWLVEGKIGELLENDPGPLLASFIVDHGEVVNIKDSRMRLQDVEIDWSGFARAWKAQKKRQAINMAKLNWAMQLFE